MCCAVPWLESVEQPAVVSKTLTLMRNRSNNA